MCGVWALEEYCTLIVITIFLRENQPTYYFMMIYESLEPHMG